MSNAGLKAERTDEQSHFVSPVYEVRNAWYPLRTVVYEEHRCTCALHVHVGPQPREVVHTCHRVYILCFPLRENAHLFVQGALVIMVFVCTYVRTCVRLCVCLVVSDCV